MKSADEILGEWREQRDRGEPVDPESVIRAHPELADELRARFAALEAVDHAFAETAAAATGAPQELGDYRVRRELGRGGMGVVYEAEQLSMRRRVALKVLYPSITSSDKAVRRFRREARAAGRLHHTNIVPVHTLGNDGGTWFYAMELVEGSSLDRVLKQMRELGDEPGEEHVSILYASGAERPPEPPTSTANLVDSDTGSHAYYLRIARMFAEVADALELAHSQGTVHRDIKPSNIMLGTDGTLKVMDFGLAQTRADGPAMTMTGELLGTPIYMSPEQAMAKRIGLDHRTDIYSLGATIYEVVTLRPPFEGKTPEALYSQIITKEPVRPRRHNGRIPRDLETIILKAIEKDRDSRYATAGAFARDLRAFADGAAVKARRIGPHERAWRVVKRHRALSAALAGVFVAGVVAAWLALALRAQSSEAEYDRLLEEADQAAARESMYGARAESAESLRLYSRAVELLPDRYEAYLGRALRSEHDSDAQLKDLEAARERGMPERLLLFGSAWALLGKNEWREADAMAERASGLPGSTAVDWYLEGRYLEARHKRAEAIECLTRAIDAAPWGSFIRYMSHHQRGSARHSLGDAKGALEDLLIVDGRTGFQVPRQVAIAGLLRGTGEEEQAAQRFAEALRRARELDSASDWLTLAEACRLPETHGWHDQVTAEALERHPDSVGLLLQRAKALQRKRAHAELLKLVDRAIELEPTSATAHLTRGRALLLLGKKDEGLASIDAAVRLDESDFGAHLARSWALFQVERFEDGLRAIDRAIEIKPHHPNGHLNKSSALMNLGRNDEALEVLQAFVRRYPVEPFAYFNIGAIHHDRGQLDEALAAYRKGEELAPADPDFPFRIGDLLKKKGQAEDALAAYDRVVKLDPFHARAHVLRGQLLRGLGRQRKAVEAFEAAIAAIEKRGGQQMLHAEAYLFLGEARSALVDNARAIDAYDNSLAHAPEGAPDQFLSYVQFCRGRARLRVGRFNEAEEALRESHRLRPDPAAVLNIARALAMRGRFSEALSALAGFPQARPDEQAGRAWLRARCLRALGKKDEAGREAVAFLDSGIGAKPSYELAYLNAAAGRRDAAHTCLEQIAKEAKGSRAYDRAAVHAVLDEPDVALQWFERAVETAYRLSSEQAEDPDFAALTSRPRYQALLARARTE